MHSNRGTAMLKNFNLTMAFSAMLSVSVFAQDSPQTSDAAPPGEQTIADEEIIVRGQRLSDIEFNLDLYIRSFLDEVAAPARSRGYARWKRAVCIGVHNLEESAAQYIVDRISAAAIDVGIEPGEPGCRPQVNIVFAADGRQMAANMVDSEPRVFRPVAGNAGMDLGREALDEFVTSEKPVRWWHVSMPVATHGSGMPAIEPPQAACFRAPYCFPFIPVAGPSRVHSGVRDDLLYVIIVVDGSELIDKSWQQIADYLAVVSLAQIDPWTDPQEFDSILNLFSNPAAYSGLTDWDQNYLRALYRFNQERNVRVQGNEIVSRIAKRELSAE